MYGSMLMAPVSDIDNCDYFLLVGTNPAVSAWNWLETVPGGWRRALERKRQRRDDRRRRPAPHRNRRQGRRAPGRTAGTGLGAAAGDGQGRCSTRAWNTQRTAPTSPPAIAELRALVADADLDDLASRCDVPRADIEQVARDFATASRAMVVTRTGVSLHLAGTVAEWLGHVLNVITGRMDRPGGRTLRARLRRRPQAGRPG